MGFSMSVKRFIRRRRYKRLESFNGGRKSLRIVRLGEHKGRLVLKFKSVPKLKLRFTKHAKSLLSRLRDSYMNMMVNLSQYRIWQPSAKMGVEDIQDKVIVEMFKSLGIQVQVLPDQDLAKVRSQLNLRTVMV
ncbi:hypothetical protein SUGI_0113930 [Cryptomeria japonica]|uniref:uncharacterized protein LOC131054271 n=1 Tax=Cryptomeria japonica TaxID=3369 RepID=UPI002408ADDA|nr:uncharacterized protein LOC131054271 [Cryptomeria japonica]GLJ09674.1 hypothetical protein SUGI_0113930 [Cryptomeria japonica]